MSILFITFIVKHKKINAVHDS